MENYSVHGSWSQPYRTHTCLWEHIENKDILVDMELLDTVFDTEQAVSMLESIGITCTK
jgi:hypothetical protein